MLPPKRYHFFAYLFIGITSFICFTPVQDITCILQGRVGRLDGARRQLTGLFNTCPIDSQLMIFHAFSQRHKGFIDKVCWLSIMILMYVST